MSQHVIGIDRGTKRLGLALLDYDTKTPLPLGYLDNGPLLYSDLAALTMQHNVDTIVYGYPDGNKALTDKIDKFVRDLKFSIAEDIVLVPVDEHYSSVQASEVTGDFGHKDISQDTISAMVILERWLTPQ